MPAQGPGGLRQHIVPVRKNLKRHRTSVQAFPACLDQFPLNEQFHQIACRRLVNVEIPGKFVHPNAWLGADEAESPKLGTAVSSVPLDLAEMCFDGIEYDEKLTQYP